MGIRNSGYNEWYSLPYYVEIYGSDHTIEEMWNWCSDNITGWGLRPGKQYETYLYTHQIMHFRTAKARDWFVLRWG